MQINPTHNIRNVLHPTDLSPSAEKALTQAIRFARRTGARLHVLHVAPTLGEDPLRNAYRVSINEKAFYRSLTEEMDNKMLANLKRHDTTGLNIMRIHSRGVSPAAVILDYAKKQSIDLIVLGTHGYRGVRKALLGSTALEVIRQAECDVMTVREGIKEVFTDKQHALLVPLDLTSKSKTLLANAVTLAKLFNLRVDLLHVIESMSLPTWGIEKLAMEDIYPHKESQIKESIQEMIASHDNGILSFTVSIESGRPSKIITAYAARADTEMVILAPNNTSWLEKMPMGSVSEHILSHAACPVYTLPMAHRKDNFLIEIDSALDAQV